jgi:ribosomal-protein-alanine N-acetyltransferase
VIRRATPADRPALDRLQSQLSRPSPDLLDAALAEVSASAEPAESATTSVSAESAATPTTTGATALAAFDLFVAVDAETGGVVGYLLAVRGDPTHVAEVVVDPDYRRQGCGAALFEHLFAAVAERHAEAVSGDTESDDDPSHRVRLAVSPDNDAALGFYRSVGFAVARRDPDFFDGEPALLLVRPVGDDESVT